MIDIDSIDLRALKDEERTFPHALQIEPLLKEREEALLLSESDPELAEMAKHDVERIDAQLEELMAQVKEIQKKVKIEEEYPNEIVMEIRAGAGGDEASLFAFQLAEMYERYMEQKGWNWKFIDESMNEVGGYKEVSLEVKGEGVYKQLMYESGVHRVQRVPTTEKQGRIHTSTVSVAILPIRKKFTVELNPAELEFELSRSGGKGGQNVNKVETAVRVIHIPTGLAVRCTSQRSQLQNKEKAMQILQSRLQERYDEEQAKIHGSNRANQVGTMDRSEKIRTYNFPQDRITDHRVNKNWSNIEGALLGNIDHILNDVHEMIDAQREEEEN